LRAFFFFWQALKLLEAGEADTVLHAFARMAQVLFFGGKKKEAGEANTLPHAFALRYAGVRRNYFCF
jgi:hypothetical protein